MEKRTGNEYVENPGECPFCGSDEIDGGVDNSFESDSMISGGCKCNSCGKTWSESYTLDGWIENNDDGPDEYHEAYPNCIRIGESRMMELEEAEQERDKLRAALQIISAGNTDPDDMVRIAAAAIATASPTTSN